MLRNFITLIGLGYCLILVQNKKEKQAKKTSEESKRRKQAKKASEENKRRKQAKKTSEEEQKIIIWRLECI